PVPLKVGLRHGLPHGYSIVATSFAAAAAGDLGDLVPTKAICDALADVPNAPHDVELSLFARGRTDAPHAPSVWLCKSAFRGLGAKSARTPYPRPLQIQLRKHRRPAETAARCQKPTINYKAPLAEPSGRSVGFPINWLRYRPGERSNQRLQARKKLLWSAKPS